MPIFSAEFDEHHRFTTSYRLEHTGNPIVAVYSQQFAEALMVVGAYPLKQSSPPSESPFPESDHQTLVKYDPKRGGRAIIGIVSEIGSTKKIIQLGMVSRIAPLFLRKEKLSDNIRHRIFGLIFWADRNRSHLSEQELVDVMREHLEIGEPQNPMLSYEQLVALAILELGVIEPLMARHLANIFIQEKIVKYVGVTPSGKPLFGLPPKQSSGRELS